MSDPNQPTAPVLWLTSRSAFERGTQFCAFARWIENHAGPFGYGYSRRAASLPLVTGTYIHEGIAEILQWIIDARLSTGFQPDRAPDEVIRWAANTMVLKYRAVVEKRGILGMVVENEDQLLRLKTTIKEQETLIEGLIWTWALVRLPEILAEYLILFVEEEEEYVLGCTCGLGDGFGGFTDHALRGCAGIGLQSRPDFLAERKIDHAWCYFELKTSSTAKRAWSDSYERKQQLIIGIQGAEKRHGVEITHCRVEGLIKGQRKRDYPYSNEMPKTQQNSLCYAYYEPPDPPMTEFGDWKPAHTYYDREGMRFTVPKGKNSHYSRIGVWIPPMNEAFPGCPEGMSRVEYWVKYLQQMFPIHLAKSLHAIGPLPKRHDMIDKANRSFIAEERLWQDRLWRIYEWQTQPAHAGQGFGDDAFMQFVETVVPRSWNCDPFGPDHPCPNQIICHEQIDAWRRPIESNLFVYRTPHHGPEAAQMEARGLRPDHGLAEEDGEQEEGDQDE